MHHQTAKAGYRILMDAADLIDNFGLNKADPQGIDDKGRLGLLAALGRAGKPKARTAQDAAWVALEVEVDDVASFASSLRDKRQAAATLRRAAKAHAKERSINLEKV